MLLSQLKVLRKGEQETPKLQSTCRRVVRFSPSCFYFGAIPGYDLVRNNRPAILGFYQIVLGIALFQRYCVVKDRILPLHIACSVVRRRFP